MSTTDLEDTIKQTAQDPAQASDEAGSFTGQRLLDQIEADKYLQRIAAAGRSGLPMRIGKFRLPGAS